MNKSIYPIKFKPILKESIWGGGNLVKCLKKKGPDDLKIGESWEISGVSNNISIADNGFLKGNSLLEILEIYMGDLIGDTVYEKFGNEFPLLIKFIDANDTLSIQVHPDDETAYKRHKSFGKTEMWYIMQAEKNAKLINGFKENTDKETYKAELNSGRIEKLLNFDEVQPGEVYFIPSGRVHGIGRGIMLAEIQQTSDITYRIYDWGRVDDKGKPRELHTDLALDVIDYDKVGHTKSKYEILTNKTVNIVECQYFKTNIIEIDKTLEKDYNLIDSFVIYICIEGSFSIKYNADNVVKVEKGETVLIPAVLKDILLQPDGLVRILEVYIPGN
jgi:mannose-6-phosphate isomerase